MLKDRRPRSVAGSRSWRRSVGRGAEVHPRLDHALASQSPLQLRQSGDPERVSRGHQGNKPSFKSLTQEGK